MTKTIEPKRIPELARARGITSAKEFAQRLRSKGLDMAPRTVARLWKGDISDKPRTVSVEKLAAVLGVDVVVLTGEAPMPKPDEGTEPAEARAVVTLKVRINAGAYNALVSNEMRYRVSVRTQVELAALLFHVVGQRSLRHRREALEKIDTTLGELKDLGNEAAPHLYPTPAAQSPDAITALDMEDESIEVEDLFAERIFSASSRDSLSPLGQEVRRLAKILPEDERAVEVEKDRVVYRINHAQALRVTGGDDELAQALLDGKIGLDGLRDALAEEETEARVAELRRRLAEYERAEKNRSAWFLAQF